MRKVLNTLAALLLLSALSSPLASFADEGESESDSSVTEGTEQEHEETDHRHSEIEEIYKNFEGVVIPPVVMRLGEQTNPDIYILPIQPLSGLEQSVQSGSSNLVTEQVGTPGIELKNSFDPNKLAPLKVNSLVLTSQTPADEFMDVAKQWGLALVIAAFSLLGIAGISTYRTGQRKSSNL